MGFMYMIELRCFECNKKLAEELEGTVKIVCSRCKRVNILRSFDYRSHKVIVLEREFAKT